MNIRLAYEEEVPAVVALLNDVTKHLLAKGMMQWAYPWDEQVIYNEQIKRTLYVVSDGQKLVGTFCLNVIQQLNKFSFSSPVYYLAQVAIAPHLQGQNLGEVITTFACEYAK